MLPFCVGIGRMGMYIDASTIIEFSKLLGALGVIGGAILSLYKFYINTKNMKHEIESIRGEIKAEIRCINEEQCLLTYGVLACLKGLKEQGCNGPVTEAVNRIEKYLNIEAHNTERGER